MKTHSGFPHKGEKIRAFFFLLLGGTPTVKMCPKCKYNTNTVNTCRYSHYRMKFPLINTPVLQGYTWGPNRKNDRDREKKKNSCRQNWMSHCLLSSSFIFLSFTRLVFTVAALCRETHRILIWTNGFCGQNLNTIWRDVKGESLYRGCCCSRLPPEATVAPTENLFTQWHIYM